MLTDQESKRLAQVVAEEWDTWAKEHQGSYECFEAIVRAVLAAAQAKPAEQWMDIATAPKDGRKIIVTYLNDYNKPRTVMARWLTDEQAAETDGDGVGLKAGWYECIDNWDDYCHVAIHEGEPTHWMPSPAPPIAGGES